MEENSRLKQWQEKYEEGEKQNQYSENKSSNNYSYNRSTSSHSLTYVGFWRRLLAYVIDSIIFVFFISVLNIDSYFMFFVLYTLYVSLMQVSSLQGTIGKVAIGAIVTDELGNKLDYTRSLARSLSIYISAVTLLIGFIMIAAHSKKKGLHDMISGTLVINKK